MLNVNEIVNALNIARVITYESLYNRAHDEYDTIEFHAIVNELEAIRDSFNRYDNDEDCIESIVQLARISDNHFN